MKRSQDTSRAITVRLNVDTANLLESIAADMQWSTSQLVGQLLERDAQDLTRLQKNNDIGGLFSHLLSRHA
nr:hypothetical protein DBT41_13640 [Aerococcus urinae]